MPRSVTTAPLITAPLCLLLALSGTGCDGVEAGLGLWSGSLGATPTRLQKLYPADARAQIQFATVELVGDELLVGAPAITIPGESGAVYVFRRMADGWQPVQKLTPGDGTEPSLVGIRFGLSVSGHGDVLAIGAPGPDSAAGRVFIYRRTAAGWVFEYGLTGPAADVGGWFGQTVRVAQGWIAVGAGYNGLQPRPGSVQLYRPAGATWVLDQRVQATTPLVSDQFGVSVSIDGDTMAIGAPSSLQRPGRVHVFQRDGASWTEKQALTENDHNDAFGWDLDLQPAELIVGAPRVNSTPPYNLGALYVYQREGATWQRRQTLTVPTLGGTLPSSSTLGYGVARVADTLLASDNYRLYLWKLVAGQWTEHAWLAPESGPEPEFWAGDRIAMSAQAIVSGNRNSNARGSLAGVVHYSFAHPITLPSPPDASPDLAPDLPPDLAPDLPPDSPPPPPVDAPPFVVDAPPPVVDAGAAADVTATPDVGTLDAAATDTRPADVTPDAAVADAGTDCEAGDAGDGDEEPACSCRIGAARRPSLPAPLALLGLLFVGRRLRRRWRQG